MGKYIKLNRKGASPKRNLNAKGVIKMQRMRNKKRLTGLVIAFLLVFVTGSAFALVPGHLDILGNVNLQAPGYVRWHSVAGTVSQNPDAPVVPAGLPIGAMQVAEIVDRALPGPNTTDQRIAWDMYFADIGHIPLVTSHRARLTATAINDSNMPAEIFAASYHWEDAAGVTIPTAQIIADFGLTVDIDEINFSGTANALAPGGISDDLIVTVNWSGITPNNFGPGTVNPVTGRPHAFAARLVITFDYAPL